MDYTTYQIIILLDDTLSLFRKRNIVKDIRKFIEKTTRKIEIKYEESKNLAYKLNEYEQAWFVAIQIKIKSIGANKRIKEIQERLNTYEEIIDFKIVQSCKTLQSINNDNKIFVVYEFDYGDFEKGVEPNVTIFDGYKTREKAVEKANELLQEGLEQYFIESYLSGKIDPFKDNDEVHLYKEELEDEQNSSVYYIKIQKINLI